MSSTRVPQRRPSPVTEAQVQALYEHLLGRSAAAFEVAIHANARLSEVARSVLDSAEFRGRAVDLLPAQKDGVNVWTPGLDAFHPPPGTLSDNGAVEVGREGYLLLNEGTNAPRSQFQGTFELPDGWAERWATALEVRAEGARELGLEPLWLMIPDKTALHADRLIDPPVAGLRPVRRLLDEVGVPLLYPIEELETLDGPAFLRTDSHLSRRGTRAVAAAAARALGLPDLPGEDVLPIERHLLPGDLGSHFAPPLLEVGEHYAGSPGRVVRDNHRRIMELGGHFGTHIVVRNDAAPDDRSCVIFGDSFTFAGGLTNGRPMQGLLWWLSWVLREVQFLWVPFGWDQKFLRAARPDLVVCEGAERFAVRPPQADTDTSALTELALSGRAAEPWVLQELPDDRPEARRAEPVPEEIAAAYEQLLGRTPSAEDVAVQSHAASFGALLEVVVASAEFKARLENSLNGGRAQLNHWTPELADFTRPAGTRSPDGSVEVAGDGMLLPALPDPPRRSDWAVGWRRAHASRTAACQAIGATFAWLVVPGKRTWHGEEPPSLPAGVLHPVARLRAVAGAFPLTDSRPSPAGYRALAAEVLAAVAGPGLPEQGALGEHEAFVAGDLGLRFRPPLGEVITRVHDWPGEARATAGGFAVRNPEAPDPRSCLVFGDSSTADPETLAADRPGIAWWLALAFREVRVVEEPFGWDPELVRRLRPDVVVVEGPEELCASVPRPDVVVSVAGAPPPLVTIVTPSYNQGRFIAKTLESVAAQDYPAIEHIVVDAMSEDETHAIVTAFDPPVTLIREPDRGQADAINKGMARGRGEILGWINSDDLLNPGAVRRAVEALLAHPEAAFVHGGAVIVDGDGNELCHWYPPPLLSYETMRVQDYVLQPAAFFTRGRWLEAGGLREDLRWTLDWDLFLKLSRDAPIVTVPGPPLATACLHPDSKTVTGGLDRYREILRMLRAHGVSPRAAAAYGIELVERWTVRAGQAVGLPLDPIDILIARGPLSGVRSRLGRRFWPVEISGDGWVGDRLAVRLPPGEGDVVVAGVLPEWCPLDSQELTLEVDGPPAERWSLGPGPFALRLATTTTGPVNVTVRAARNFVPAKAGGPPGDMRQVSWVYGSIHREI